MEHERFLDYIRFEKRCSGNTYISYKKDLEQFKYYLEDTYEITDLTKASHQHIRSWVVLLMETLSPVTIRRKLSALRSFYKYLRGNGLLDQDPMGKLVLPKIGKRVPSFIDNEGMNKLLYDDDFYPEGYDGILHKTIIITFYGTGIRRAELLHLKDHDIDVSRKVLKVMGKRNKERFVPLNHKTLSVLSNYLIVKRNNVKQAPENSFLFVDIKGKPLYADKVYTIVNKYLSQVSSLKKTSPHVLRHTFATHLLNNGADINSIKEMLGHSSLAATQMYTHSTIEELKSIYNQAHPFENEDAAEKKGDEL
ncbi:MAG: tyrosine-type recombinase/integrase [Hyphomicrobiales bacterium]